MSEDQDHDMFLKRFLPVQPRLRGYLLATLRDPAETDDVFQEVAMVLWQKFGDFDQTRSFAAWAIGIARLQVLKRRQSFARSRLVFSEEAVASLAEAASEDPDAEDVRRSHLSQCLEKLPPDHRAVVAMRFEEKRSLAEIAATLRKREAAVSMMMVRIRRWLRACVDESMALDQARVP